MGAALLIPAVHVKVEDLYEAGTEIERAGFEVLHGLDMDDDFAVWDVSILDYIYINKGDNVVLIGDRILVLDEVDPRWIAS